MPGYIDCTLQCFYHPRPTHPEHAPHAWQSPDYGACLQLVPNPNTTAALDPMGHHHIQEVIGVLLYYAHTVDPTLLVTLNTLALQQAYCNLSEVDTMELINLCVI